VYHKGKLLLASHLKYHTEYELKYPVVRKSSINNTFAYCAVCHCDQYWSRR